MKKLATVAVLFAIVIALAGCPAVGIPDPTAPTANTLVVHNGTADSVSHLSVVRVGDDCSKDTPLGVNLLPATLEDGKAFSVKDLPDGRYYCQIGNWSYNYGQIAGPRGYVTIGGGASVDWFAIPQ